jgi:DNA gyrase subunit A
MTTRGYIKRVPSIEYRAQRRGGKGVMGMATKDEDALTDLLAAGSLDHMLFFSNHGKVYAERAFAIPETRRANKGTLIHSILPLAPDETITAILPVTDWDSVQGWYFVTATRHGRIKRVDLEDFAAVRPSGLIAMSLDDGDTLDWVKYSNGDQHVILVTESGQAIRFHEKQVRVMGRPAGGVNAIRLVGDDVVAGMDVIRAEDSHLLVVTANGHGKRTALDEYAVRGRYGVGVRTLSRNQKTGPIVAMRSIQEADDIMLITENGVVLRTQLDEIRETGRSTQGVVLMNLAEGDRVVGLAVMDVEAEAAANSNGNMSEHHLEDETQPN